MLNVQKRGNLFCSKILNCDVRGEKSGLCKVIGSMQAFTRTVEK